MNSFIFFIRLACFELAFLLTLTVAAVSQDRDGALRRCLSIADMNERVDCLETGAAPNSGAPLSNTAPPRLPRASPSFDCRAARSSIERAICADPSLAEWDSRMGQLYQQALRLAKDRPSLLESQQLWLTQRDGSGSVAADTTVWSCLLRMT